MKFIVIGLGNFGSSLALTLTSAGHEVIGVDNDDNLVNVHKNKITHSLKLDSTRELAVKQLPLSDTDAVIIAIGEEAGAAITTAALFKKYVPKCRIVARYTSDIQKTIFEAMGIEEIVNPEAEFAHNFANRLTIAGNINTYLLDKRYEIAEIKTPEEFIGKTVRELDLEKKWNISMITIIRHSFRKNLLGRPSAINEVDGIVRPETRIGDNDTLILFGKIKDLEALVINADK